MLAARHGLSDTRPTACGRPVDDRVIGGWRAGPVPASRPCLATAGRLRPRRLHERPPQTLPCGGLATPQTIAPSRFLHRARSETAGPAAPRVWRSLRRRGWVVSRFEPVHRGGRRPPKRSACLQAGPSIWRLVFVPPCTAMPKRLLSTAIKSFSTRSLRSMKSRRPWRGPGEL